MIYLQHNHSTSLKTIAKVLADEISNITNVYNIDEVESIKSKKIAVIDNMEMDINKYIAYLDKSNTNNTDDVLPKIVILRSNTIKNERLTQQHFNTVDRITLVNKDDDTDKIFLEGTNFAYETDIQFAILSRNNYAGLEIQLELKRLIATVLKKINYSLVVYDDTTPNLLYKTDEFGSIALYGFENAQFEKQSDDDTGYNIIYLTGTMEESYFKLKTADVYKKKEIYPKIL